MQIKKVVAGGLFSAMLFTCGFAHAETTPLTKVTGPLTNLTLKVPTKFGDLGNVTLAKVPVAKLTAGLIPIVPGISPALGLAIIGAANPLNGFALPGLGGL